MGTNWAKCEALGSNYELSVNFLLLANAVNDWATYVSFIS